MRDASPRFGRSVGDTGEGPTARPPSPGARRAHAFAGLLALAMLTTGITAAPLRAVPSAGAPVVVDGDVRAAAESGGRIVLAGVRGDRSLVVWERRGSRYHRIARVPSARVAGPVGVAVNGTGAISIAWIDGRFPDPTRSKARAIHRPAADAPFGPPQSLGDARDVSDLRVDMSDGGLALVAWDLPAEGVMAALREPGAPDWGAPVPLSVGADPGTQVRDVAWEGERPVLLLAADPETFIEGDPLGKDFRVGVRGGAVGRAIRDGATWSTQNFVDADVPGTTPLGELGRISGAQLVTDGQGGVHAVWAEHEDVLPRLRSCVRMAPAGAEVGATVDVRCTSRQPDSISEDYVHADGLKAGGTVITWGDLRDRTVAVSVDPAGRVTPLWILREPREVRQGYLLTRIQARVPARTRLLYAPRGNNESGDPAFYWADARAGRGRSTRFHAAPMPTAFRGTLFPEFLPFTGHRAAGVLVAPDISENALRGLLSKPVTLESLRRASIILRRRARLVSVVRAGD